MHLDVEHGVVDLGDASAEGGALLAPRWEWRVFSRGSTWLSKVAAYLAGPPDPAVADTYLLSSRSVNAVTLGDHHIDVSELERATPDGIGLWRHTMRLTCPLGARQLAALFRVWGLDEPGPQRPCWSIRQFEHIIIDPRPDLLSMPVVKRRTPLTVSECAGEYVDLLVMGEHWESVAVYDADAARVRGAAATLGLDHFTNTGYPAALSAMAGLSAHTRVQAAAG